MRFATLGPSLTLSCCCFVCLQLHGTCRNLRKVNLLLQALENAGKKVDYYALDLSREELERTLAQLPAYTHVRAHGLLGTYDDGREWLKQSAIASRQKCILSLGSSIGMLVPALSCPTPGRSSRCFCRHSQKPGGGGSPFVNSWISREVVSKQNGSKTSRGWGSKTHPLPSSMTIAPEGTNSAISAAEASRRAISSLVR